MTVDEELISRSKQENVETDNSESDASSSDIEENEEENSEENEEENIEENEEQPSLREEMQKSKNGAPLEPTGDIRKDKLASLRQQKINEEKLKGKATAKPMNPAKKSIAKLLQASWENIIDSFGLTIIWIDIHIFLSHVLGKDLFCELGEEWFPEGTPRNVEGAKKSVGMTEGMGVACVNVGCLFLLLMNLAILAMLLDAIKNPMSTLFKVISDLFS